MVTVAVDGNGADLGPDEVAQGASLAAARGVRVLLFADAARISVRSPTASSWSTPRFRSPRPPIPRTRSDRHPEASIVQAAKAVADGRAQALVSGRLDRVRARCGPVQPQDATAASTARRWRCRSRARASGRCCSSTSARTSAAGRSTSSSLPTWARPSLRRCSEHRSPRVALLSNGEEPAKGTAGPQGGA